MSESTEKQHDDIVERPPPVPFMRFEGPWTEADEIFVECLTGEYEERLQREAHEREAREVMEASETRAENSLGEPVFGPREPTFAERYPNLGKHVFITWPWGAEEDVWLEHMTGEPQGERRGS